VRSKSLLCRDASTSNIIVATRVGNKCNYTNGIEIRNQ